MTSIEIRKAFLDFFSDKNHKILPSAPMVIKNDPTLMFTNAGMNQFKDIFLGNNTPAEKRVANSQKCLRVSGKHNDLEEVGHDTYHHTMFEMLGNWSFGDYFKENAIDLAWEFLTKKMNIDKNRLYVTIFKGDEKDGIEKDWESFRYWQKHLPSGRILEGSKKDNFWEMGETGPCGPCSEIHIDIRNEDERKEIEGAQLVNKDHPLVIEIWNLVFIQYNRKANGKLENLPERHIDTGMGFERLAMVVQGKKSNYDTDIFQGLINEISGLTGIKYGQDNKTDTAMRVIADHLRAISFSVAEGQIPSNNKAGYVIRRILRRAVRYSFTFLGQEKPFIYKLVPELVSLMGGYYPELKNQQSIIEKVIYEEEQAFLRTLDKGISMLNTLIEDADNQQKVVISGKNAFTLYDTYGFPPDLTALILKENGLSFDYSEYTEEMKKQKSRSKNAADKDTGDWTELVSGETTIFTGYDTLTEKVKLLKYRKIRQKNKEYYQLIFDRTPFYAEGGGQVGDKGFIDTDNKKINIIQTVRENNQIIHITNELPDDLMGEFIVTVNSGTRIDTVNNHSATHLLHFALRDILGAHVEQKGSLVHPEYLRFDFAHFQKLRGEEIREVEKQVNERIRQNLPREEWRDMPYEEALEMGAMALFGEKYGDTVRVIRFGNSVELCGGTHVDTTGQIGFFKIIKESAIAAGIRRIEAITGRKAQDHLFALSDEIEKIRELFPGSKNLYANIQKTILENQHLKKDLENVQAEKNLSLVKELRTKATKIGDVNFIAEIIPADSAQTLRDISFQVKSETENLCMVLGAIINEKAALSLIISEQLVKQKGMDASMIIREIARMVKGGGGGQSFFATAGGKDPEGLTSALSRAKEIVTELA